MAAKIAKKVTKRQRLAKTSSSQARVPAKGASPQAAEEPFWKAKTLEQMSEAEWESVCDGCGRCCLNKLEDEDTGVIEWTSVSCVLLDTHDGCCSDYANRHDHVPDCVRLTPKKVRSINWLPPTCGYRLLAEGRDLYWWHPLVSGDPNTVHEAGISVRDKVISEKFVSVPAWERFIVDWPGEDPKPRRRKVRT
jgi:uncharacterized cysteine cluster protein YcgN (CxxCxxCC family)